MTYTNFSSHTIDAIRAGAERATYSIHVGGPHWVVKYPNGYGFSAVKHWGSYGGSEDLWELAVILFEDDCRWYITYDTPITSDVLGWLSEDDILRTAEEIRSLR